MAGTWAILYIIKAGLFWPIFMALTWVAYIVGMYYILTRDRSWWWLGGGLVVLCMVNLFLFFALYRQ